MLLTYKPTKHIKYITLALLSVVALGQTLHGIVLDDQLKNYPLTLKPISCYKDFYGTATLPAGRVVVLSVDIGLFSDLGSGSNKNEQDRQFDHLLQHFEQVSRTIGANRIRLLFFPERPHLTFYPGLTNEQMANLTQWGLQEYFLQECLDSASHRLAERTFRLPGLYLLENGQVQHRYLRYPWYLPEDSEFEDRIADLVSEDARRFLEGREPANVPIPLLDLNVAVPAQLQNTARKQSFPLMSFSGLEAEAPAGDRIVINERAGSLGGRAQIPGFESGHLGAAGRTVIELLTPLLARYDLAGVGLVQHSSRREAMYRAFPKWSFVALAEPEDYLRYWEASNFSYFVSGRKVRHAFSITPFDLDLGFAQPFYGLLEDWIGEAR